MYKIFDRNEDGDFDIILTFMQS